MDEIGVAFGGGGAKGSYEVGVWQALNEMDFNVTAVCGTSIGAINGAMIAQGDFELLAGMWTDISLENIVNASYAKEDNLFDIKNIPRIAGDIYKNQSIDITPLKYLMQSLIDEQKIRSSKIRFGLSTFSVTDKKELDVWREDIPEGHMLDYIFASAALFGLPSPTFDDKAYFDGCVKNNIPINMLIDMGYKDIVAVDVGGFGFVRGVDNSGINIFNLKCSDNIIGLMEFNSAKVTQNIKMGYLDTYKMFGKLSGKKYYIETNSFNLSKMKYSSDIAEGIENAAAAFSIDRYRAYDMDGLIAKAVHRYKHYNAYYQHLKDVFSQDSIFNILTQKKIKLNDAVIVTWITDLLRNKKRDFIKNKIVMNILGSNYNAAQTLLYLLNTQE